MQAMVNSLKISNKISSREFINEYKDLMGEWFNDGTAKENVDDITIFFDGNSSMVIDDFWKIIICNRMEDTIGPEHKIMENLVLNVIDNGSITKSKKSNIGTAVVLVK